MSGKINKKIQRQVLGTSFSKMKQHRCVAPFKGSAYSEDETIVMASIKNQFYANLNHQPKSNRKQ
jgi:hypothetical protein